MIETYGKIENRIRFAAEFGFGYSAIAWTLHTAIWVYLVWLRRAGKRIGLLAGVPLMGVFYGTSILIYGAYTATYSVKLMPEHGIPVLL